jgi:glycosyltransferase involved in cell wall biosynthesis
MPTLTIAVLTLNEAEQIDACLRSAAFADQLLVIDSGSTDATVAMAQGLGAEVHVHADWQGFAVQRNRQIAHTRSDWVLFLDADEVIPPALADEIRQAVARDDTRVYDVAWLQMAFGRPLTHMRSGVGLPRLFPMRELIRFDGVVHEGPQLHHPDTPHTTFNTKLAHYSRRTVHQSLLKLAQYAQLGAVKRAAAGKRGGVLRGMASGLASFVRLYVFHRGFLCGSAGFLHCFLVALESFFRYAALAVDGDQLKKAASR